LERTYGSGDLLLIKPDYELQNPFDAKSIVEQLRIRLKNAVMRSDGNKALSSEMQKIYFDQNRREDEFNLGDLVLYKSRK